MGAIFSQATSGQRVLTTNPDDLSSVARTHQHGGKREPTPTNCLLTSTHVSWHVHGHTHTQIIDINVKWRDGRRDQEPKKLECLAWWSQPFDSSVPSCPLAGEGPLTSVSQPKWQFFLSPLPAWDLEPTAELETQQAEWRLP